MIQSLPVLHRVVEHGSKQIPSLHIVPVKHVTASHPTGGNGTHNGPSGPSIHVLPGVHNIFAHVNGGNGHSVGSIQLPVAFANSLTKPLLH